MWSTSSMVDKYIKTNLWTLYCTGLRASGITSHSLPSSCRPVPLCPLPAVIGRFSLSPAAVSHRWPRPFPLLRRPSSPAVIIAARCHIPRSPLCLLEVTGLIRLNDIPDMMEKLGYKLDKRNKGGDTEAAWLSGYNRDLYSLCTDAALNNATYERGHLIRIK